MNGAQVLWHPGCASAGRGQPWASDALGHLWLEEALAADGSAVAMASADGSGAARGLVNELVCKIADKLCLNDRPSKAGDFRKLDDKDLQSSAVAAADAPAELTAAYPELLPAFRLRLHSCGSAKQRFADALSHHRDAAAPQSLAAGAHAVHAASVADASQGVFVCSRSLLFPSLTKYSVFVSISALGFKWFDVVQGGGQGEPRGALDWTRVRGAARAGEWRGLFAAEIRHPGAHTAANILWCDTQPRRDEVVAVVNSFVQRT